MAELTRRQALKVLGGGLAATTFTSSFSLARAAARRPTVAVFGGGVAGLTAAHELVERGFDVSVYESRQWGGKVRTFGVPGTGSGGRAPLPAEHAIHMISGAYRNLQDTLRRIPFGSNPNGVYDNLVPMGEAYRFAEAAGEPDVVLPSGTVAPTPLSPNLAFPEVLLALLPGQDVAWIVQRVAVFMSSSDQRRFTEWERMTWWDFLGGSQLSDDAHRAVARTLVQNLAGQPATKTSARAFGAVVEALLWYSLGRYGDGPMSSHFDRPKNEAFIQPWIDHLTSRGARLNTGWALRGFDMAAGRIASARVVDPDGGPHRVIADYYVSALPQERVPDVLDPEVLEAAPELAAIPRLPTIWSNSVMLYLRRPVQFNHGQAAFMDSPWALLGAPQAQFWRRNHDFARDFGDGTIVDCISMAISDWESPGILFGKAARECSAEEITREIWAQMQRHDDRPGEPQLDDGLLAGSYVDPGLIFDAAGDHIVENQDPLFAASADSWSKRPPAATGIANLMFAGDWIQNGFPIAATDAANEGGRRAAAAIVAESGVRAEPVTVNEMYRAPELEAARDADAALARRGLPHVLDVPEGAAGIGLANDVQRTLEQALGLRIPRVRR